MSAVALDHVNIRVPAAMLETVRSFYLNVVGLRDGVRPPFGSIGHWLYAGAQPVIHLSVLTDAGAAAPTAGGAVDHIAFRCADLEGMQARLASMNIPYRQALVPLTKQLQLFVRDPAGNGVELNFTTE